MNLKKLHPSKLLFASVLLLSSCGNTGGLEININGPSSIDVGVCTEIVLELVDGEGLTTTALTDQFIALDLDADLEGKFFFDENCSTALISPVIDAGQSDLSIYFFSNAEVSGRMEAGIIEVTDEGSEELLTDSLQIQAS